MTRAALFCPGRGSYTDRSLGSLGLHVGDAWVKAAETLRLEHDLPSLVDLDRAERFDPARHLLPANVSPLIYLVSMLDARAALSEHDVVCVGGNSLGWYTALAVAGSLSFEDGFRLVQEMSILQQELAGEGGQILYPLIGDDWRGDPERAEAVQAALESSEGEADWSIELGGYAVLAGSEAGVAHLLSSLPKVKLGPTPYPFRLMQHGPYHTSRVRKVAERARERLAGLAFRAPDVTLIDGRGKRFSPWSSDPAEIERYTLGAQVTTLFSFTTSVRVALREYAPDRIVLPGPGNSLGGVCAQVLISEGYRDLGARADFDAVQKTDEPVVVSMRR